MRSWRWIGHVLVFLVTFSVHVRVKAEEHDFLNSKSITQLPNAIEVLQDPRRCLSGNLECALQTKADEQFKLELKAGTVHVDRSSSVIRESDHEVRLVSGTIWIEAQADMTVHTEFGDAHVVGHGGQLWATRIRGVRAEDRVEFTAIGHDVELDPRGAKQAQVIEPGQVSYLGRVGPEGVADYGQPLAVSFREHIERWARLYPHTSKQFQTEVQMFYGVWKRASERSAEAHQALFERKIASLEAIRVEREKERAAIEEHDRQLREEFRRRFFNDE